MSICRCWRSRRIISRLVHGVTDCGRATVNGASLLMARRLVEAGVPFITVFWAEDDEVVAKKCLSGGGWDTHGNNFSCLKENLLPEFDRGFSALLEDLAQRGLLPDTLISWADPTTCWKRVGRCCLCSAELNRAGLGLVPEGDGLGFKPGIA